MPDGDSDIKTTLPSLLCSIVDFIVEATRADRGRSVLITTAGASPEFQALLSTLISYSRITAEEEQDSIFWYISLVSSLFPLDAVKVSIRELGHTVDASQSSSFPPSYSVASLPSHY